MAPKRYRLWPSIVAIYSDRALRKAASHRRSCARLRRSRVWESPRESFFTFILSGEGRVDFNQAPGDSAKSARANERLQGVLCEVRSIGQFIFRRCWAQDPMDGNIRTATATRRFIVRRVTRQQRADLRSRRPRRPRPHSGAALGDWPILGEWSACGDPIRISSPTASRVSRRSPSEQSVAPSPRVHEMDRKCARALPGLGPSSVRRSCSGRRSQAESPVRRPGVRWTPGFAPKPVRAEASGRSAYAAALIDAPTFSMISPIWSSLTIKGGVSSIVSPAGRIMIPALKNECSSAR
jgi:hypothetical protein